MDLIKDKLLPKGILRKDGTIEGTSRGEVEYGSKVSPHFIRPFPINTYNISGSQL